MPYTHNTLIDLCGEEYDAEVEYEFAGEAYPMIYGVEIVHQTCKQGESFYSESGHLQHGPAWIRLSITDLLSANQMGLFAVEITTAELEQATDAEIERAHDRAIDLWEFNKKHGLDNYPGYAVA